MEKRPTRVLLLAGLAFVIIASGLWLLFGRGLTHPLPLAQGETVASWNFIGPYKDGGELEKRATDEIVRLKGLLGSGEFPDYQILVGIAGQYELLGDGKSTYEYLGRAIKANSETGLAWHNLGVLLARLKAPQTARIAYTKAIEAQPLPLYHTARLDFLIDYFPDDRGGVEAAFTDAVAALGEAPFVLEKKAGWLTDTGRIQEAISLLKTIRTLVPASRFDAIDAEIMRLEKTL